MLKEILLTLAILSQCQSQAVLSGRNQTVASFKPMNQTVLSIKEMDHKMYSGQTNIPPNYIPLDRNHSDSTNVTADAYPLSRQVVVSMAVVLMSVTTIVGNLLVIMSVTIFRKLHTIPNMFVVSLATADLIMGRLLIFM